MAKKITIIYGDEKVTGFNITSSVGTGGQNFRGDVMLIQAMFNFIALGWNDVLRLGISAKHHLPDVTGVIDSNTIFAIIGFQQRWVNLLFSNQSGWIFPADYTKKQEVVIGTERRQQMFLLHQFAQDAAARLNEADYTIAMLKEFPELKQFF